MAYWRKMFQKADLETATATGRPGQHPNSMVLTPIAFSYGVPSDSQRLIGTVTRAVSTLSTPGNCHRSCSARRSGRSDFMGRPESVCGSATHAPEACDPARLAPGTHRRSP